MFSQCKPSMIDKFVIRPRTRCWVWTAATGGKGKWPYGIVSHKKRMSMAHRVSYELLVGPIPDGFDLDHKCRNTLCINPDHLEPVTHQENIRRGYALKPKTTHCRLGHEMTEANTYMKPARAKKVAHRECRTCRATQIKAHYARKEAAHG